MARSDRREAILSCVIDLLATRGLEGVTHRAVDAAAGLPAGSTTYYFPKKAAMLLAAAAHLADLLGKDCNDLQAGFAERLAHEGMIAATDHVGEALIAYADSARTLFLARIELTMAAARRPDLAGVGEALTHAARRPIAFFLALIAGNRSVQSIDTCAGLIDGIALMHVTGQGPKPSLDQIRAVFRAVV